MAQAIHCDVHGRQHPADVLVSQLANGDTMAACFLGYVELARALVADQDVRDAAAAAETAAVAAQAGDPDQAEVDATDAEVEARLAAIATAGQPAALGELAGLADHVAAFSGDPESLAGLADHVAGALAEPARSPKAEALGVAQVVPKGTSRSRKAHQARQRARAARAAPKGPEVASGAPGPPDGPSDDPGGGDAPA